MGVSYQRAHQLNHLDSAVRYRDAERSTRYDPIRLGPGGTTLRSKAESAGRGRLAQWEAKAPRSGRMLMAVRGVTQIGKYSCNHQPKRGDVTLGSGVCSPVD